MTRALALGALALTLASLVSGCGGGGGASSASSAPTSTAAAAATGRVLPVPKNPISNASTAPGLTITKALVENNVSPDTGKAVDDHLEIALRNTSSKPLDRIGVYYRITDPARGVSEGYYTKLDRVTIDPGASRVVHFDPTGAADHYPVNKYSLYYTDKNALVVDVIASARNVKPATFTVKKDAGGAEAGVE
ncbi:MAG: hypothetical protein MSC30_16750 [Gaiellaceae bacterium MAG52_C11]|nr:hypothetical protein [Candidatus Gaiellasilicea maunaloa]